MSYKYFRCLERNPAKGHNITGNMVCKVPPSVPYGNLSGLLKKKVINDNKKKTKKTRRSTFGNNVY